MAEADDNRIAERIRSEIFLPALQRAAADARGLGGSPGDMLNGSMMAVGDMLTTLIGKEGASALLRGFADYIEGGNRQ